MRDGVSSFPATFAATNLFEKPSSWLGGEDLILVKGAAPRFWPKAQNNVLSPVLKKQYDARILE